MSSTQLQFLNRGKTILKLMDSSHFSPLWKGQVAISEGEVGQAGFSEMDHVSLFLGS